MCVSYPATLRLMDEVGKLHTIPIQDWIKADAVVKFVGDNVDKQRYVRDYRSDNQGQMLHMYSILVGRSRTPAPELQDTGTVSKLEEIPNDSFLPQSTDIQAVKANLVILVRRILTEFLTKVVPKHILHQYSNKMAEKSEVIVLDVLMKNETKHEDMLDIMRAMQDYLGESYPQERCVASGGDHLTCERQRAAKKHHMDENTKKERLDILELVIEDWHCQLCAIMVRMCSLYKKI